MFECHAWSGIAHYLSDLFLHLPGIAMYRAMITGWLGFPKRADIEPAVGVIQQRLAVAARYGLRCMMVVTEDLDHRGYGCLFSGDPGHSKNGVTCYAGHG